MSRSVSKQQCFTQSGLGGCDMSLCNAMQLAYMFAEHLAVPWWSHRYLQFIYIYTPLDQEIPPGTQNPMWTSGRVCCSSIAGTMLERCWNDAGTMLERCCSCQWKNLLLLDCAARGAATLLAAWTCCRSRPPRVAPHRPRPVSKQWPK